MPEQGRVSSDVDVVIHEGTRVFIRAEGYEFEVVNQWGTVAGAASLADLLRRTLKTAPASTPSHD